MIPPTEKPLFLSGSAESREAYRQAVLRAAALIRTAMPPHAFSGKSPAELEQLFSGNLNEDPPLAEAVIEEEMRRVIIHSVHPEHPHTAAHLHCPVLIPALAAEVILTALNQSMDSYDQAPAATIIEQKTVRWLCAEMGLPTTAGGTFSAGGTISNYTGLLLARDHFALRRQGWSTYAKGLPPEARRYRILCSAVAHFSVEKSAVQLGLGTEAVLKIPVDAHYRLRVDRLEQCLRDCAAAGEQVIAVVGTAGTTDFGSIDPLPEIARLAHAAGAWFHVDAAYGGAMLFSHVNRTALRGIELADSVAMDFHKLLWMPVSCAAFVARDVALFDTIKLQADYLNPAAHEELGIPDLVVKSLQTTRRFDALKVWLCFRSIGRKRMGEMIDSCLALAREVAAVIAADPAFELLHVPELSSIVFRLRGEGDEVAADQLNCAVRRALFDRGEAVIGHTVVGGRNFLKFTLLNPTVASATYGALLGRIKDCAVEIAAAVPTVAYEKAG